MINEKSCGAVVYSIRDGVRIYLIEQMVGGHYAMCKGHVEAGETESETALREIREETGITVRLDTNFRESVTYSPRRGHMKEVIYFVGYADNTETANQPEEVTAICWKPYEEALDTLTYPNDRVILSKAEEYLREQRNA